MAINREKDRIIRIKGTTPSINDALSAIFVVRTTSSI